MLKLDPTFDRLSNRPPSPNQPQDRSRVELPSDPHTVCGLLSRRNVLEAIAGACLAGRKSTCSAQQPNQTPINPIVASDRTWTRNHWAKTDRLFSKQVLGSIASGLSFLRRSQKSAGDFPGNMGGNVGVVSLVGLAYLATGNLPQRGLYGTSLQQAIDYVVGSQLDSGFIIRRKSASRGEMYGHGFATLFLAEVLGVTPHTDLGPTVRAAVNVIVSAQHSSGGWRYQPRPDEADLSVTICQMMALRAARNAGIYVPTKTIHQAIDYIKRLQNPDGGFMYQASGGKSRFPLTAGAIVALQNAGRYQGKELEPAYKYLQQHFLEILHPGKNDYFFYAHYYSIQALWQRGGKSFTDGYQRLRDALINSQNDDGSWSDFVGPYYGTAMACLILSAPRTALPIFQR